VRITSQLIDTATGTHLWAERYDRDLTDIFAVQDDITSRVAAASSRRCPGPKVSASSRSGRSIWALGIIASAASGT
jgi:hypothetical protein